MLQRLLATVHIRAAGPGQPVNKTSVLEYGQYRGMVLFWAMVDLVITEMWSGVSMATDQDWSQALADWIRNNDENILSRSTKILNMFQEDLVPAGGT